MASDCARCELRWWSPEHDTDPSSSTDLGPAGAPSIYLYMFPSLPLRWSRSDPQVARVPWDSGDCTLALFVSLVLMAVLETGGRQGKVRRKGDTSYVRF